jgi:hypothetical protein
VSTKPAKLRARCNVSVLCLQLDDSLLAGGLLHQQGDDTCKSVQLLLLLMCYA